MEELQSLITRAQAAASQADFHNRRSVFLMTFESTEP